MVAKANSVDIAAEWRAQYAKGRRGSGATSVFGHGPAPNSARPVTSIQPGGGAHASTAAGSPSTSAVSTGPDKGRAGQRARAAACGLV